MVQNVRPPSPPDLRRQYLQDACPAPELLVAPAAAIEYVTDADETLEF